MATQVGRLAMRHEGESWNAYYALADTMQDAILLGSINIDIVKKSAKAKQLFTELMTGVVSDMIEELLGERPSWDDPVTAPESERSGHG